MSGSQAPATPSAGGSGGSGAGGGSAGGETAGRHKSVIVHPLVLLSVTDHSYREHREMNKRVLGVLLGEVFQGRVVSVRVGVAHTRGAARFVHRAAIAAGGRAAAARAPLRLSARARARARARVSPAPAPPAAGRDGFLRRSL